jgi:glycosyltransferase involved in cell wall biosynthesis
LTGSPGRREFKLLVVTLYYPPYVAGGYELLTRDAVVALRKRGYKIRVLAGKGERFASESDVMPWLEPDLDAGDPFRSAVHASNRERLRLHFLRKSNLEASARAIAEEKPDLVFFFNLGLVSLAPILAARRAGVATLGYLSDSWAANHWVLDWRRAAGRKPLRLALLSFLWRCFRSYVRLGPFLCCSRHLLSRLEADRIAHGSGEVLHLGIPLDVESRTAEIEEPKRSAGAPLRVACISALWAGKGQDVLVKAMGKVKRQGKSVELWLAAASQSSAYREELEALVRREELEDEIEFLDDRTRAELSRELEKSHALIVPSVWEEPFPLSTLEGMAHGLAVGVSDAGGSPEAIVDGVDGRVFEAGDVDALARVLLDWEGDEEQRLRMGVAGRKKVRTEFSHSGFVDGLERAIQRSSGVLEI